MPQVNWELFTREEKDAIMQVINLESRENLATVIETMTPEKEMELQKIADSLKPLVSDFESEALKEYTRKRLEAGLAASPESPAEEAELQKLLDEEQVAHQKKVTEHNAERVATVENITLPEAAPTTPGIDITPAETPTGRPRRGRPPRVTPTNP